MAKCHWDKLTAPELFERLVARARQGLNEKFWGNGAIPDGTTAETLALDAIEDVLLGRAAWDPNLEPSAYRKLADVVDTKLSNLVRCYRNKKAKLLAHESDEPGKEDQLVADLLQANSDGVFLAKVKEKLTGQEDLLAYVSAAAIFDKRADIAVVLDIEPSEVTNLQKRVRRIFASLALEFGVKL